MTPISSADIFVVYTPFPNPMRDHDIGSLMEIIMAAKKACGTGKKPATKPSKKKPAKKAGK